MSTVDHNLSANLLADLQGEREHAHKLAERYRCPFVDLEQQRIDPELFRSIPADLMFRFNFVPLEAHENQLSIAVADPSLILLSDELPLLLGRKLILKVATANQISDLLKRTEQSQRVLEQATEAFTLQVVGDEDETEETISADTLTRESSVSPIVRLVDTLIFTALERRASDIHIEARDIEVVVKYRIDGILVFAMTPISKEWHSTILSRIKVMSELDIAERRVPQDGRFRVRYKGRFVDFRVSIMPSIHGEDAVLRVLDKETLSEKFANLSLDVVGFGPEDLRKIRRYIREPYGMVWPPAPPVPARPPRSMRRSTKLKPTRTRSSRSKIRSSTRSAASRRFPSMRRRALPSPAACAPSCVTTRTRSWSAKFATKRPRKSPSSPP